MLLAAHPLPWRVTTKSAQGGKYTVEDAKGDEVTTFVLYGLAESLVNHFNGANGRLTHRQKKSLGALNAKLYAVRNKNSGKYLGGKYGNSERSSNIYEAKLWRSPSAARRRMRYNQDLEVIEVQLTAGKVTSV